MFLLFASSNVSRSFCIPILLGMIKGLIFSSSRGVSVSSLELSFKVVFFVSVFVVFFAFVLLVPLVLQNLAEIENFHLMKMTMNRLVEN